VSKKSQRRAKTRRGQRGLRGAHGAPGIAPEALKAIIRTMEKLQSDAAIQFTRIAQIQAQVDQTLKALKEMGERAGQQRRKR
jgi:hypothetical protein